GNKDRPRGATVGVAPAKITFVDRGGPLMNEQLHGGGLEEQQERLLEVDHEQETTSCKSSKISTRTIGRTG
ncbi:unnamed protein product, partial [Amoebophrya sp. A25]